MCIHTVVLLLTCLDGFTSIIRNPQHSIGRARRKVPEHWNAIQCNVFDIDVQHIALHNTAASGKGVGFRVSHKHPPAPNSQAGVTAFCLNMPICSSGLGLKYSSVARTQ